MTVETYRELFCYAAFPVFATTRGIDKIIYKNLACERHFPNLSKKNLSKLFFFSKETRRVGPVKLAGFGVYHTAVALEDEDHSVFLFLSHLQYETGLYYAGRLIQKMGSSLTDFLTSMQHIKNAKISTSKLPEVDTGLYTETFELLLDEENLEIPIQSSLYQAADCVFKKLNSAFSDFGYQVDAHIEDDVPSYLQTSVPVQEILFILGRLLYLQLKLSKTKEVKIFLSCDLAFSQYMFHIVTGTDLSKLPVGSDENETWLRRVVPECAIEFLFLHSSGLLDKKNFQGKLDSFGNLTLLYSVPYTSPETYYVRSVETDNTFLLCTIENMLDNIRAKLTNNDAFC